MNRFYIALFALAAIVAVVNIATNARRHRTLVQLRSEAVKEQRRRVVQVLKTENETLSKTLRSAAHSYCDGNDLVEYPLPKYDKCPSNSTLNIIPFHEGMTTGLRYVLLGALMSFQESRCFAISKDPKKPLDLLSSSILTEYFEEIGLAHDDNFVKKAMMDGRYEVRNWKQLLSDVMLSRIEAIKYDYHTFAYTHPKHAVDGLTLKRDFLRHMWHLLPLYRENVCITLKDEEIFDTDYIALSIRRGDLSKKLESVKTMGEYIRETERVLPLIFDKGQTPKIFVATDDCAMVDILRKHRPHWTIKSQCDQLNIMQKGYSKDELKALTKEQRDEHFRKFFVELYALAFSKVFIGVSHTNVAWFAYMMRPNVDRSTFILLDYINDPKERMHDPTMIW
mmetsp:Transcript_781/g.947  ORF Transcript_781/g.947 Transcript_781/m.947 type:complete len:394 (-) Transcript_781:12-1193(-)